MACYIQCERMRQKREMGFSPNLCDWKNCTEINRKIKGTRGAEQVCGLGDLNSVLNTELEVQMGMPSHQLQMPTWNK